VGNRFDLDTLSMVHQKNIHATAIALKEAIREEIIGIYKLASRS
jgi:predicted ATPase